jgi:hypothetical protein
MITNNSSNFSGYYGTIETKKDPPEYLTLDEAKNKHRDNYQEGSCSDSFKASCYEEECFLIVYKDYLIDKQTSKRITWILEDEIIITTYVLDDKIFRVFPLEHNSKFIKD